MGSMPERPVSPVLSLFVRESSVVVGMRVFFGRCIYPTEYLSPTACCNQLLLRVLCCLGPSQPCLALGCSNCARRGAQKVCYDCQMVSHVTCGHDCPAPASAVEHAAQPPAAKLPAAVPTSAACGGQCGHGHAATGGCGCTPQDCGCGKRWGKAGLVGGRAGGHLEFESPPQPTMLKHAAAPQNFPSDRWCLPVRAGHCSKRLFRSQICNCEYLPPLLAALHCSTIPFTPEMHHVTRIK